MPSSRTVAAILALSLAALAGPASGQPTAAETIATRQAAAAAPEPDKLAAMQAARAQLAAAQAAQPEDPQAVLNALDKLGAALQQAKQLEEALATYQRAADLAKRVRSDKHPAYAAFLFDVADVLEDMGRLTQSRDTFIDVVQILANHYGMKNQSVARSLEALARVSTLLDDQKRAETALQLAVRSRTALDGPDAPTTLRNIERLVSTLNALGRSQEAYELARRTLDRPATADNEEQRIDLSFVLGLSANQTDRYDEAHTLLTAVVRWREARLGVGHAKTLRAQQSVANVLGQMGRWPESLAMHDAVYQTNLRAHGPDASATLAAAGSRAWTLSAMGQYVEALALEQDVARRTEKAMGAESIEAQGAWLATSMTLRKIGRLAEAGLLQERLAKSLLDKFGLNHPLTVSAIDALAATNRDLGRWAKSAELGQLVIDGQIKLSGPEHRDTLAARHDRALNLIKLGQLQEAHDTVSTAIAVIDTPDQKHPAMPHLGHYYRTLGETELQMGRRTAAATSLQRALVLTERAWGAEHPLVGNVLVYLAQALDDPNERVAVHARALRLGRAAEYPEVVWRAADGLRSAYADLGNRPLAVMYGKQAINAVQALRKNIGTLSSGMQKTFLDDKRGVYLQTADLLIAEGRLAEGQQVLGLLKEEEYYEFVSRSSTEDGTQTRLSLNTQEAGWQQRYAAVSEQLVEISKRKAALDAKLRSGSLSDEDKQLRTQYEGDLKAAREAFDATMRQIADESRRLADGGAPRLGSEVLDSVRAMRSDLKQLGHGAVLVHYLMARDKLWILLTTPEVQVARESKVSAADLNRRIDTLRTALRNPRSDAKAPARELYNLLLAPIAADLAQAQAQTLMLSLDGALRYVPFAALHDGQGWAMQKWRFAIFTEAAKSKIKDVPQARWSMTGLGLTKAVAGFAALPAVREELSGLVRRSASGSGNATGDSMAGVMDGEALFDEAFTVQRVMAVLGDPNPVLHIASHFKFTPGTEADSYLVMGDGGRLSLQQIRQDDLQFNVDLLTLSACDTAVGDNARGQEVEGLGALAQKQGAKAVLATLWPVADASTGIFMREMYRRRSEDKLTKAEAIRQVQLAFMQGRLQGGTGAERGARVAGEPAAAPAAGTAGFAHPFYWAPFILMGNWL